MTAYHGGRGMRLLGMKVPDEDPVYKVSIIPRGRALGVTMFLPVEDRYSSSKQRLESKISSLYGGRLAEELIFGAEKSHDRCFEWTLSVLLKLPVIW